MTIAVTLLLSILLGAAVYLFVTRVVPPGDAGVGHVVCFGMAAAGLGTVSGVLAFVIGRLHTTPKAVILHVGIPGTVVASVVALTAILAAAQTAEHRRVLESALADVLDEPPDAFGGPYTMEGIDLPTTRLEQIQILCWQYGAAPLSLRGPGVIAQMEEGRARIAAAYFELPPAWQAQDADQVQWVVWIHSHRIEEAWQWDNGDVSDVEQVEGIVQNASGAVRAVIA